jgi:SAM-dependent methyltransferase
LHCIDPSDAIQVARDSLTNFDNLVFHQASVDSQCLPLKSQDFGYSLGVLHHIPDTTAAICSCVNLLKPGAPFLLYLYYSFENRPYWFKFLWYCSDFARRFISLLPPRIKQSVTDIIALFIYFPLSLISYVVEKAGFEVSMIPLSYYRNHTFYTMRTDARDRFGTPLEKRFNKIQISRMMEAAGLIDIEFSESLPYWCAVGFRR